MKRLRIFALVLGAILTTYGSVPAQAALGESEWSVDTDREALQAVTTGVVLQHAQYTVQEIVSNGARVREYLDKNGTVFAVGWSGRVHPDLSSLLGSYYEDFQRSAVGVRSAAAGPRLRSSRGTVRGSRVVVERSGHMMSLRGRAYVPQLLPSGVSPREIR